ncbi:hypothetical protein NPIL_179941 [Nephila pilipes]|uniref:Uncharacterized protein n=1 Tax=Nephila pilipes TaxID=299642 RepID=A0A8X6TFA8_NEPPI|nr:hypothetical protein NPIL_179941 [Nephila pilipes]
MVVKGTIYTHNNAIMYFLFTVTLNIGTLERNLPYPLTSIPPGHRETRSNVLCQHSQSDRPLFQCQMHHPYGLAACMSNLIQLTLGIVPSIEIQMQKGIPLVPEEFLISFQSAGGIDTGEYFITVGRPF